MKQQYRRTDHSKRALCDTTKALTRRARGVSAEHIPKSEEDKKRTPHHFQCCTREMTPAGGDVLFVRRRLHTRNAIQALENHPDGCNRVEMLAFSYLAVSPPALMTVTSTLLPEPRSLNTPARIACLTNSTASASSISSSKPVSNTFGITAV